MSQLQRLSNNQTLCRHRTMQGCMSPCAATAHSKMVPIIWPDVHHNNSCMLLVPASFVLPVGSCLLTIVCKLAAERLQLRHTPVYL